MNRLLLASIAVAGLVTASWPAQAEEYAPYPAKPIRLIVPSTPGSPPIWSGE